MVPATMVLLGLGLGVFGPGPARANRYLVIVFAVVLVVQSVVVFGVGHQSSTAVYWLVQGASLAVGLALLNAAQAVRHRQTGSVTN